jgi:uncharacterized protein with PIN domain
MTTHQDLMIDHVSMQDEADGSWCCPFHETIDRLTLERDRALAWKAGLANALALALRCTVNENRCIRCGHELVFTDKGTDQQKVDIERSHESGCEVKPAAEALAAANREPSQ